MSLFLNIPEHNHIAGNAYAFAVRDLFPVTDGHALVITRREIATWWDATAEEKAAVLELVDEVRALINTSHSPDGFNVGFNEGAAAGQTIPHLHVHVIPRYKSDVPDPRGGIRNVIPNLGNYLASKQSDQPALVTPRDGALFRQLGASLRHLAHDTIDLVVSFVQPSGVDLLGSLIDEALERGAHIRLLTTDYLCITDPSALGFFLDRVGTQEGGGSLEVRVFSDPSTSFHPKAYIFSASSTGEGVAFVGSSNISRSGISSGVEWNLRAQEISAITSEFTLLWNDNRSVPLTSKWLDDYIERRVVPTPKIKPQGEDSGEIEIDEVEESPIEPWGIQKEALAALTAARAEGHQAGLVVMATGLGKTWLAAFDSTRPSFKRVLFIAHREEILTQARDVYRRIRPSGSLTMFTGNERDISGDVVFASIQSLQRNLQSFEIDRFDYIVVDEFHHASAPTYVKVINHFEPKFLLGLTATPDRSDAADLLALCGDNLVYECGLVNGINLGLLSPLHYRAVKDIADYEEIPWRGGRFDIAALSEQLETQQRAKQIFDEWSALGGEHRRTIGFCCSITHAEFMAGFFCDLGVEAVAVHSGTTSAPRGESLERLDAGELPIIFTVDLFNEGVDIPALDIVLLLRPTESPIVFFQQLGRGLRAIAGKSHLDVLDLVGNHRSFLLKARLLAELVGSPYLTPRDAVAAAKGGYANLPEGCSIVIDLEVVELLEKLLGAPNNEDRIIEIARAWAESHDDVRPTALEIALATRRALDVKSAGGWFGLLSESGMLSDAEKAVFVIARDFLIDIEHGSYQKSFKLVTIQALIKSEALRKPTSLSDVCAVAKTIIYRDPRLLADLNDALGNFLDPSNPTTTEWQRYWQKNPISAWIGEDAKGSRAWFNLTGDQFALALEIPAELGETFDAMVAEITEYRLYRYLLSRVDKKDRQRRQPIALNGQQLDAAFAVEALLGIPNSIVFESAGGAGKSGIKRNPDYVAGIDVVLSRLRDLNAVILDAYVDSGNVKNLPIPDRRVHLGTDYALPLDLRGSTALEAIRKAMLKSMAKIGKAATATSAGGNSRKALRIQIENVQIYTPKDLANYLGGTLPLDELVGSLTSARSDTAS